MKVYDVGMTCGRFQTFHIGHKAMIDAGRKLCDRMLVIVGSAQECGTERNPLDISTRIKMIKTVYAGEADIMIHSLADLTNEDDIRPEWGRYLLDHADRYIYKAPELMIYGNDESRSKWFAQEDIKDTSELIINRGRIPISATMVRNLMVQDKRKEWMELVDPRLHKMYDEIRAELMTVPFYQDLQKKFFR